MRFALLFFLSPWVLVHCTHTTSSKEKRSAKYYYKQTLLQKNKKNYQEALELILQFKQSFNYSPLNKPMALNEADIYFEQKKYKMAAKHYKLFKKVYPKTKRNYVLYQLGLSYFNQMPQSFDRDLSKGDLALDVFSQLSKKKNPYTKQSLKHQKEILDLKAKKSFHQALFYIKKDWKGSAFKKLQQFLNQYPKSDLVPKALFESYKLAKKTNKKEDLFKKRLLKEFPKSKEASQL